MNHRTTNVQQLINSLWIDAGKCAVYVYKEELADPRERKNTYAHHMGVLIGRAMRLALGELDVGSRLTFTAAYQYTDANGTQVCGNAEVTGTVTAIMVHNKAHKYDRQNMSWLQFRVQVCNEDAQRLGNQHLWDVNLRGLNAWAGSNYNLKGVKP